MDSSTFEIRTGESVNHAWIFGGDLAAPRLLVAQVDVTPDISQDLWRFELPVEMPWTTRADMDGSLSHGVVFATSDSTQFQTGRRGNLVATQITSLPILAPPARTGSAIWTSAPKDCSSPGRALGRSPEHYRFESTARHPDGTIACTSEGWCVSMGRALCLRGHSSDSSVLIPTGCFVAGTSRGSAAWGWTGRWRMNTTVALSTLTLPITLAVTNCRTVHGDGERATPPRSASCRSLKS